MVIFTPVRRRLTASLLGAAVAPEPHRPETVVSRGVVLEARSHLLVTATDKGEERFILNAESVVWRGGRITPAELAVGEDVFVLRSPSSRWTAQRVWSGIARVTGVIVEVNGAEVTVDAGHDRGHQVAVIPESATDVFGAHPRLEPGLLFDAVGLWRDGVVEALTPAAQQPSTPAVDPPRRTVTKRHRRDTGHGGEIDGSVTWFDPARGRNIYSDPIALSAGAAYPAVDPLSDCGKHCAPTRGCVPLPLMSLGMMLSLRNLRCPDDEAAAVPVTACASMARYFCDHFSEETAAAPRGRLAELTLASFIALGGSPETGCFPGRLTVPGRATTW
ncbi:hypothetical protein J4H86_16805 [Spiractinospora alimapuensis]|uniref:hypothetical protein n=1 Tax=Spiractinospora alimapuensis TaxID=2820884 RepID=UPI001F27C215|nr:hypothetical protein [Spiractinospora alimapuensis]QVQ50555.1 hypothetical protein J4H86_16805 [Spiractinospora alimapuensis]